MDNRIQIDISKYKEQKTRGNMEVGKIGNNTFLTIKRFSPETGEELEPLTQQLKPVLLEQKKEELLKQIEAIDAILADIDGKTQPTR